MTSITVTGPAGRIGLSKHFDGDTISAAFPFDDSQLLPGLWEFETTATNEREQTTNVPEAGRATVVSNRAAPVA